MTTTQVLALSTLKSAIYTWANRELHQILALEEPRADLVIFTNQGKARPEFPYCSINVTNPGRRIGAIDELRADNTGAAFELHGQRETTISINIFGPNANDLLSRLRDTLDWPRVIDEFSGSGIAHLGETGPQDLTALESTQFVERSQLDLLISYAIKRTPVEEDAITYIEEVDVEHEDPLSDGSMPDIEFQIGESTVEEEEEEEEEEEP